MLRVCSLILYANFMVAADTPPVTCKLVMISASAELPEAIDMQSRPFGFEYGTKVTYMIEGQDLIGFKEEGLQISSITTADGKDISVKENGLPGWEQDSFPRITKDGKYGFFGIDIKKNILGKVDGLKVNGTIVALTGSERQTKKLTFKLSDKKTEDVGGLKVSLTNKDKSEAKENPFGGGFLLDEFGIRVIGDFTKVAEVTMSEGDTKLESRGASWSNNQKSWNFTKPTGDTVTVEITWWNKMGEITVPIGE